jgi:competence protein ComGC
MVKRGFFFWIEMIFLIIIITIVVLSLPKSEDGFLAAKDSAELGKIGFNAVQNLDQSEVLETYINSTNFASSNFTALSVYIRKSLPSTTTTNIEYFNGTTCFSESGTTLSSCGNFTISKDTVVADYAFARAGKLIDIRLYLRRLFA